VLTGGWSMQRRHTAVVGSPIAHSLSPVVHRAAYAALGLDWTYDAIEVRAGELARFVRQLGPVWVGLSVTMPLKQEALQLAAEVDPVAARVGAANTLLCGERGTRAVNTDVAGFARVLRDSGAAGSGQVTILGAGATARSALAAVGSMRDQAAPSVAVIARTLSRASDIESVAPDLQVRVASLSDEAALADALHAPVVINATPAGALDPLAAALSSIASEPGCWIDVSYAPWPTPIAAAWQRLGGVIVGGLELLLGQAYLQVELMTGRPAPEQVMRAAAEAASRRPSQ
jgi:shikimate dehydrogenase